jgi:hypothetical protein
MYASTHSLYTASLFLISNALKCLRRATCAYHKQHCQRYRTGNDIGVLACLLQVYIQVTCAVSLLFARIAALYHVCTFCFLMCILLLHVASSYSQGHFALADASGRAGLLCLI